MGPQASLPSAAQPAVMDIRRRRRRFLEIDVHNMLEIDEHYKHAKILLCICESSRKKRKINKINNERETGERAKRIKKNNKKLVLIIIIAYFCTRIKNKSLKNIKKALEKGS